MKLQSFWYIIWLGWYHNYRCAHFDHICFCNFRCLSVWVNILVIFNRNNYLQFYCSLTLIEQMVREWTCVFLVTFHALFLLAFKCLLGNNCRYNANLKKARLFGIKKSMVNGGGMGLSYIVVFCTYALAFWYGGKLTVPPAYNNYTSQGNNTIMPGDFKPPTGEYTVGQMILVRLSIGLLVLVSILDEECLHCMGFSRTAMLFMTKWQRFGGF